MLAIWGCGFGVVVLELGSNPPSSRRSSAMALSEISILPSNSLSLRYHRRLRWMCAVVPSPSGRERHAANFNAYNPP